MNKKLFTLLSGVAIITSASLQSCADEFDPAIVTKQDAVANEYANNFVKEFGTPDPNHTWGFGIGRDMLDKIDPSMYWGNGAKTRALTGAGLSGEVDNNVNMWTNNDANAMYKRIHIPGWPNDDNKYYTTQTSGATKWNESYNYAYKSYDNLSEAIGKTTMGDVTESEIQKVSEFMRTYKEGDTQFNEARVYLHISDFFIQQVSHDFDRDSEGNRIDTRCGQTCNYSMDHLQFKSLDGGWTHVNDFNAAQNQAPQEHVGTNNYRKIKYVKSSGTEDFNYHPSMDNISQDSYYDKWVLMKISFYDEDLKMNRTGYYLCFDYQVKYKNGGNTDFFQGDGYYSNWIVKITPGFQKQGERWPKRFMTEDLGNTLDFDFNDAVFDLTFASNANDKDYYDALLTIRAAGGTRPIYVAINPNESHGTGVEVSKYEIHKLLGGVDHTQPINVIVGTEGEPAIYRIYKSFKVDNGSSFYIPATDDKGDIIYEVDSEGKFILDGEGNKIPVMVIDPSVDLKEKLWKQMAEAAFLMKIYVSSDATGSSYNEVSGYAVQNNLRLYYNNGEKGTTPAPQLFNCSTDAQWTFENGHIKDAYKHFANWVQAETSTDTTLGEQGDYRLRWDEREYFGRVVIEGKETVGLIQQSQEKIDRWKGSWDFGPSTINTTETYTDFINGAKLWKWKLPEEYK